MTGRSVPDQDTAAKPVRCGRIVDPGSTYPHPCVLPEGHDGPCDGRPPELRSAASLVDLAGYSLEITVEEGGYLKAYANPPDGAGIISYGLQGRIRDELFDGVRKLVDEYLEAQRADI